MGRNATLASQVLTAFAMNLHAALQKERSSAKGHEVVIGFSRAIFEHAREYREVYHALLHPRGWQLFRQHLEQVFDEMIRRECKEEIQKLKRADSEVPVDLFCALPHDRILFSPEVVARSSKPPDTG